MHDMSLPVYDVTMHGYDLYENTTVVREYIGNYSTFIFNSRATEIINQHDKNKV